MTFLERKKKKEKKKKSIPPGLSPPLPKANFSVGELKRLLPLASSGWVIWLLPARCLKPAWLREADLDLATKAELKRETTEEEESG